MTPEEAREILGVDAHCGCQAAADHAESLLGLLARPSPSYQSIVLEAARALQHPLRPMVPGGAHDVAVSIRIDFRDLLGMRALPFTCMRPPSCGLCTDLPSRCTHCSGVGRIPGELMRMTTGSNRCPNCEGTGFATSSRCRRCSFSYQECAADTTLLDITPEVLVSPLSTIRCKGLGGTGHRRKGDLQVTVRVTGIPEGAHASEGAVVLPVKVPVPLHVLGGNLDVSKLLGAGRQVTVPPLVTEVRVGQPGQAVPVVIRLIPGFPGVLSDKQESLYKALLEEETKLGGYNHG